MPTYKQQHQEWKADWVDCVLGLGANLFYNSPMEACIVICRRDKPARRLAIVEPVFANICVHKRMNRFTLRSKA